MVCVYEATAIEQVYSLYLANQVFGTIIPLPNNTNINISGRNAVPFLTQSGVDRGILRAIWTVADPQSFGSLTNISQFHVILRLVAMAQAGMLNNNDTTIMGSAISQHASRQLPLPVFSNIAIPHVNQLMTMYGHLVMNVQSSSEEKIADATNTTSASGGFFSLQPSVLQSKGYQFGGVIQTPQKEQSPNVSTAPSISTPGMTTTEASITHDNDDDDDGFGDFGSAPSIPVPPRNTVVSSFGGDSFMNQQRAQQQQPFVTDFGRTLSEPISGNNATPVIVPTSMSTLSVSDAFEDLGAVQDAPLPSLNALGSSNGDGFQPDLEKQMKPEETVVATGTANEEDDEFGEFETGPTFHDGGVDATDHSKDEFENREKKVENSLITSVDFPMVTDLGKTMSEPMVAVAPQMIPATSAPSSLSITDAFSDMPVQEDATLPSMQHNMATNTILEDKNLDEVDGVFGNFEKVEAAPSEPKRNDDQTKDDGDSDDEFGDFGGVSSSDRGGNNELSSGSDVMGSDCVGINMEGDLPPSMTDIGRTVSEPIRVDETLVPAKGMMGTGHLRSISIDDAFGELASTEDRPLPSLEMMTANSNVGCLSASEENKKKRNESNDDFGDFTAVRPQPEHLAGISSKSDDGDGDEFEDFDAAPLENDERPPEKSHDKSEPFESTGTMAVSDADRQIPIFDALGTEDAPLPSLEMLAATPDPNVESKDLVGVVGTHNNDSFGGFKTADTHPSGNMDGTNERNEQGELRYVSDDMKNESTSDDYLLQASTVLSTPAVTETGPSLSIADPFGNLEVPDAPLPGLMSFGGTSDTRMSASKGTTASIVDLYGSSTTQNVGDSGDDFTSSSGIERRGTVLSEADDFGDFGSAKLTIPADCNENSPGMAEDEFGDFGSAEVVPPIDNEIQDGPSEEDDFGDFGSAEVTPAEKNHNQINRPEVEDDFGDFGSAEQNIETQSIEEHDFGDFRSPDQIKSVKENTDLFGDFRAPEDDVPSHGDGANLQSEVGDFEIANFPPQTQPNTGISPSDSLDIFSSFTAPAEPISNHMQQAEEDDFGDFGSAMPNEKAEQISDHAQQSGEDDFGAFGSTKFTTPAVPTLDHMQQAEEDDFGDFGSAMPNEKAEQISDHAQQSGEDDFGAFGSTKFTTPAVPTLDHMQQAEEDDFGDFGDFGSAMPNDKAEQISDHAQQSGEDDFGAFGSAKFTTPAEQNADHMQEVQEDAFGAFESSEPVSRTDPIESNSVKNDDVSDFGDFSVLETPQTKSTEQHGDFGDFSSSQNTFPADVQKSAQMLSESVKLGDDEDEDDWGDFENVTTTPSVDSSTEEAGIRDRICLLALQLPKYVLHKSQSTDEIVDLGDRFEAIIGTRTSMTKRNRNRVDRCLYILERLTSKNNCAQVWAQIFGVANAEFDRLQSLLNEAESFSSHEWNQIKSPLSVMVRGLSEYMRVTRSIVASIGDLLLLEKDAAFTAETWSSTWCSLSVLEKAVASETKWKELQTDLMKTPLTRIDPPSVEEIRSVSDASHYSKEVDSDASFCHLTLQPFQEEKNKSTTKQKVVFQGKCFMACSANMLANRCRSFEVG